MRIKITITNEEVGEIVKNHVLKTIPANTEDMDVSAQCPYGDYEVTIRPKEREGAE